MLKGIPFSAAWSSPSGRTMATASEILRFHPHVPLHLDEDLRELSFGVHERQLESEVFAHKNLEKTFFDVLHSDTLSFTGGETGLAFRTRVLSVFERIVGANLQGNVLVVSHGVTLSTLLTLIDRSRPIEPLANASVSTIQISNGAYTIGSIGALPSSSAAS
jgi:probable phosphoglycerate mutase